MRVSVIGIGYVGAVSAACLANSGHDVIAVDRDDVKIRAIQNGHSPIVEHGLEDLIIRSRDAGKLTATHDLEHAILNTDITLICVGTPSREDGSLDYSYVVDACTAIGKAIHLKNKYHSVVLRSTVIPGTGYKYAIPALEKNGAILGQNFGYGTNPEFLRESTALQDYYNPPKIVAAATDDRTLQSILALYETIKAPCAITTVDVAEAVKYADNVWHAVKVGFANELGNILAAQGVDSHKVMDVFLLDTKLNISPNYLKPGFAFGGSCLPKDLRAIRAAGQSAQIKTSFIDGLIQSNDNQIERALNLIRQTQHKNIALFGLAFKTGTDDTRESPLLKLADRLLHDGYSIRIYDPNISKGITLRGPNSYPSFITENLTPSIDDKFLNSDIFVIGNPDPHYLDILKNIDLQKPILDLCRLKNGHDLETRPHYSGICW